MAFFEVPYTSKHAMVWDRLIANMLTPDSKIQIEPDDIHFWNKFCVSRPRPAHRKFGYVCDQHIEAILSYSEFTPLQVARRLFARKMTTSGRPKGMIIAPSAGQMSGLECFDQREEQAYGMVNPRFDGIPVDDIGLNLVGRPEVDYYPGYSEYGAFVEFSRGIAGLSNDEFMQAYGTDCFEIPKDPEETRFRQDPFISIDHILFLRQYKPPAVDEIVSYMLSKKGARFIDVVVDEAMYPEVSARLFDEHEFLYAGIDVSRKYGIPDGNKYTIMTRPSIEDRAAYETMNAFE